MFLFSSPKVQAGSAAQSASYTMGDRVFPGGKRPEQEAHPSTLFSVKVKNEWNFPSAPHAMDRHNFAQWFNRRGKGISWTLTQVVGGSYHCETHYCTNICSSLSTAVDCAEPGRQLATVFHLVGSVIDFGLEK